MTVMNEKITAQIGGHSATAEPDIFSYNLNWQLSQEVAGVSGGQANLLLNIQQTDTEIEALFRETVAADAMVQTGQTFTASDVRGCKL